MHRKHLNMKRRVFKLDIYVQIFLFLVIYSRNEIQKSMLLKTLN